ncbi:MAG: stage V sporulation protein AD [Oscillospiraceae bacterium]|nr:stage V sporulation protein AD [Oscillospiraceae bacterium]
MGTLHRGRQSFIFDHHPSILAASAIGGKKEQEGPLAAYFDYTNPDTKFRQPTWEKAESKMQQMALDAAKEKLKIRYEDIDVLFAGDLLNQCISSSYSVRDTAVPFMGLYGACSTMAESLCLAGMAVNAGYVSLAAAMSSSHFATAERQYRFPLGYGGQRTPTAQWTVTGAACALIGTGGEGPYLNAATIGAVWDYNIKDANNMGAAMAPAAYQTLRAHLDDLKLTPGDYDLIITGDLGAVGKEILMDLFRKDGVSIGGVYNDCGTMIFDLQKQDVHSGGSGCGCGSVVLCGYIMKQLQKRKLKNVLFCGTGALHSPTALQQRESIPGVCHAVSIGVERR